MQTPFPLPLSHFPFPTSPFPLPLSHFPFPTSPFPLPLSHFPFSTSPFPLPTSQKQESLVHFQKQFLLMNANTDKEKSINLLEKARYAYRNLDIPKTYHLVLDSIQADPGNFKAYYSLKNVMSTVAFSYPEIFDAEKIKELFRLSLAVDPYSPILWNQLGRLHRILDDYDRAEEAVFRSVIYGNTRSHWFNQIYSLFELGYLYKNIGRMDIFTNITFSVPWNVNILRKIKTLAFPSEILKRRTTAVNFNVPPIRFLRELDEKKFHLLSLEGERPTRELFLRLLTALGRTKVQFSFFSIPPQVFMTGLTPEQKQLTGLVPSIPSSCYAALQIADNFTIQICPVMERKISHILSSIQAPWKIIVNKYSFCECR